MDCSPRNSGIHLSCYCIPHFEVVRKMNTEIELIRSISIRQRILGIPEFRGEQSMNEVRNTITRQMYELSCKWLDLAVARAPIEMQSILQVSTLAAE
jgi:hypothetical protein